MKHQSGKINRVILPVTVGDFLSLGTMSLCSTKRQRMVLRNLQIKTSIFDED